MFWCCSSLACSWGYMETIACHSFPLRVFPERAPGITRKSEKCSLDWVRAPLKSEADVFFVHLMSPCQSTVRFFYIFWSSGLWEALGGLWFTGWFWAQRSVWVATAMGKAGGKIQSSVPPPPSISAHGKHCWDNATPVWSSFTHSKPERAGCANPELSTTHLHPCSGPSVHSRPDKWCW